MISLEIIKPSFIIEDKINSKKLISNLERYGRVSHKSESNIKEGTAENFLRSLIKWGHESVLEHEKITVRFICNRGISHELVRHRIAAYTQESTRYCNYSGKIQFIKPLFFKEGTPAFKLWYQSCQQAAENYEKLVKMGKRPEEAREVLTHSLKTEIVTTYNIRQWRHVFEMRCQKAAHPQIRELMVPLLKEFQKRIPVLFDDFQIEEKTMTAKKMTIN